VIGTRSLAVAVPVLRLPKHTIDYPTPAGVRPRPAAVAQDVGVVAAGVFERIGQNRHPVERTLRVDGRRERNDRFASPSRVEGDGTERIASNAAEESGNIAGALLYVAPVIESPHKVKDPRVRIAQIVHEICCHHLIVWCVVVGVFGRDLRTEYQLLFLFFVCGALKISISPFNPIPAAFIGFD